MGKLVLILGGVRSGKSSTAEQLARALGGNDVLYVATAQAFDEEMAQRIQSHRSQRPAEWQTLEAPLDVAQSLTNVALPRVVLLDCITLLTSNVLLSLPDDCTQDEVNAHISAEITALIACQQKHNGTWIVVSNEVGMGVVPPTRLGRFYRDGLGMANQQLARAADEVLLMVAGLAWRLKG